MTRCKFLIGLAGWHRDQLGSELERNVWIRTHPSEDYIGSMDIEGKNDESDIKSENLTNLALCGANEDLLSLFGSSSEEGVNAVSEPNKFSEIFWRATVSSLGGDYMKVGTCVEYDHDACHRVLADAREKNFQRLMERMHKVASENSNQDE